MNYVEIVNKLVGGIRPIGDSARDAERFENLKTMCDVVQQLSEQIARVYLDNKGAHEQSIVKSREYAGKFIKELREELNVEN